MPCLHIAIKQSLAVVFQESEIEIVRIFGNRKAFKMYQPFSGHEVKTSQNGSNIERNVGTFRDMVQDNSCFNSYSNN